LPARAGVTGAATARQPRPATAAPGDSSRLTGRDRPQLTRHHLRDQSPLRRTQIEVVEDPVAHEAMPDSITALYTEAREIGARSPKSAAALLRLALQHLLIEIAEERDISEPS